MLEELVATGDLKKRFDALFLQPGPPVGREEPQKAKAPLDACLGRACAEQIPDMCGNLGPSRLHARRQIFAVRSERHAPRSRTMCDSRAFWW
jgi:hypothetical protein